MEIKYDDDLSHYKRFGSERPEDNADCGLLIVTLALWMYIHSVGKYRTALTAKQQWH